LFDEGIAKRHAVDFALGRAQLRWHHNSTVPAPGPSHELSCESVWLWRRRLFPPLRRA